MKPDAKIRPTERVRIVLFRLNNKEKCRQQVTAFLGTDLRLGVLLAGLVGHAAAGLAGGLAGGLALAAAAVDGALAQVTGLQGLDTLHNIALQSIEV